VQRLSSGGLGAVRNFACFARAAVQPSSSRPARQLAEEQGERRPGAGGQQKDAGQQASAARGELRPRRAGHAAGAGWQLAAAVVERRRSGAAQAPGGEPWEGVVDWRSRVWQRRLRGKASAQQEATHGLHHRRDGARKQRHEDEAEEPVLAAAKRHLLPGVPWAMPIHLTLKPTESARRCRKTEEERSSAVWDELGKRATRNGEALLHRPPLLCDRRSTCHVLTYRRMYVRAYMPIDAAARGRRRRAGAREARGQRDSSVGFVADAARFIELFISCLSAVYHHLSPPLCDQFPGSRVACAPQTAHT